MNAENCSRLGDLSDELFSREVHLFLVDASGGSSSNREQVHSWFRVTAAAT